MSNVSAQTKNKIKAAAYQAAAESSTQNAVKLLRQIASELEDSLWEGPGNR